MTGQPGAVRDAIAEMTRPRRGIDDVEVSGRRVLVRVDFNVPIEAGRIVDDRRIRAALPTITRLRERGARIVLATHLGRPGGAVVEKLRVAPLAERLGELLGITVPVSGDVAGEGAIALVNGLHDGDVGMLENVRFEAGEETDDPELADRLASLADVYVDDAFGAAHRAHASTHGVATRLPAVAGLLMQSELTHLGAVLAEPARPLVAIVGGSKVSGKLAVLQTLLDRVDVLWVGGAMACTFYRAMGAGTGTSLVEEDRVEDARALLERARANGVSLRVPPDAVVATGPRADAAVGTVAWNAIPDNLAAVDVGPATVAAITVDVVTAATVVWNGPLGIYEVPAFAAGTTAVAHALADSTATTVVGGGDCAAAVEAAGVADRITFISTGGGATLELLEGRSLPGVAVLQPA